MRRLKFLPWREILLIAALVNSIVIGLELFLDWGFTQSPIIYNILVLFRGSVLGVFTPFAVAVGMGALAVYFMEYLQQQFLLNRTNLWILALCVFLGVFLKSIILGSVCMRLLNTALIGVTVGVFWKGRPYWR
ncbi:peptide chain release factor 1 [Microcoleus sp. ARI1-B5]|uniref:peptide chain release factor 1 n=1 Tax=unclassified Microcoleus TaxID=2642155 RepID=UPI002FD37FC5